MAIEIIFVAKDIDMAIILKTEINNVVFLSELSRIELLAQGAQSVDVSISHNGVIFSNTYTPYSNGAIVIYDLDKVIEPYMDQNLLFANQFTLTIDGTDYQFIAIAYTSEVNEPATTFTPDFFLTSVITERDTCVGRYEVLTPYADSATPYTIDATYWNGSAVATRQFSGSLDIAGNPIDVSPALWADETKGALIAYTVNCGNRTARYRVLPSLPKADPAIIFRNRFGCWETIYLTGLKKQAPKYTRSTAVISGCVVTYDVEEEMIFEAQTGALRSGMEDLAIDLARSKAVFLLGEDGAPGDEIIITDSEVSFGNDDEIHDAKFSFRRANVRSALLNIERPPRLFDSNFDATFN